MLIFIIGPFLVLVVLDVQLCNIILHAIGLKLLGKKYHNLKFRGNGVGHYPIRSSSLMNSTKYFFLHNFQGILKLRGWWCLNLGKAFLRVVGIRSVFEKQKLCLSIVQLSDITFHGKHWRMLPSVPIYQLGILVGYEYGWSVGRVL